MGGNSGMIAGAFSSTSGKADSVLTTKGDLATYSTTRIREAVGTNNYTLMADSGQATGIKWGASATSTLTAAGDLLVASGANALTRLARGSDNQTLMMNGTSLNWETVSAGDANLTYIGQVTLGSVNQNIGLASGLDDYEWIMCFFHLQRSAVTDFTPELQVYQGGSLTTGTSYSHNEVIDGSSTKTNSASNVPVDCGTTDNKFSSGTLMFNTPSLNNQGGHLIYNTGATTSSAAAFNSITTWKMSGGGAIEGINFKQNVTDGTFSTVSKLEFVGIKEI